MKTDQRPKYHLYWRAFENAKWILTESKSGEVSEYNYSEMSGIVKDAYISWHNSYLAKPPYNEEELNPQDVVIIRYLHRVSCVIYRGGYVEGVSYSKILPDYTIDCYDWRYQCPHCKLPQDEVRGKEKKEVVRFFCPSCHKYTEFK